MKFRLMKIAHFLFGRCLVSVWPFADVFAGTSIADLFTGPQDPLAAAPRHVWTDVTNSRAGKFIAAFAMALQPCRR